MNEDYQLNQSINIPFKLSAFFMPLFLFFDYSGVITLVMKAKI